MKATGLPPTTTFFLPMETTNVLKGHLTSAFAAIVDQNGFPSTPVKAIIQRHAQDRKAQPRLDQSSSVNITPLSGHIISPPPLLRHISSPRNASPSSSSSSSYTPSDSNSSRSIKRRGGDQDQGRRKIQRVALQPPDDAPSQTSSSSDAYDFVYPDDGGDDAYHEDDPVASLDLSNSQTTSSLPQRSSQPSNAPQGSDARLTSSRAIVKGDGKKRLNKVVAAVSTSRPSPASSSSSSSSSSVDDRMPSPLLPPRQTHVPPVTFAQVTSTSSNRLHVPYLTGRRTIAKLESALESERRTKKENEGLRVLVGVGQELCGKDHKQARGLGALLKVSREQVVRLESEKERAEDLRERAELESRKTELAKREVEGKMDRSMQAVEKLEKEIREKDEALDEFGAVARPSQVSLPNTSVNSLYSVSSSTTFFDELLTVTSQPPKSTTAPSNQFNPPPPPSTSSFTTNAAPSSSLQTVFQLTHLPSKPNIPEEKPPSLANPNVKKRIQSCRDVLPPLRRYGQALLAGETVSASKTVTQGLKTLKGVLSRPAHQEDPQACRDGLLALWSEVHGQVGLLEMQALALLVEKGVVEESAVWGEIEGRADVQVTLKSFFPFYLTFRDLLVTLSSRFEHQSQLASSYIPPALPDSSTSRVSRSRSQSLAPAQ
ncbi:hypothetical protein BDY24DRAFT_388153 [Mrakia frigida]|uniref:uncharacterized protein n=1 Tax=Mrakia frigida TaxID=29902 RepID=UPI003FCC029F